MVKRIWRRLDLLTWMCCLNALATLLLAGSYIILAAKVGA